MGAAEQTISLEVASLQLINMVAYGSSSRAHNRRTRAVTGLDLPPSDIRILEFLAGRPPLPLSRLASELGIDLAQASRQAAALEVGGHVVRMEDPSDRRRTLVRLSAETTALMDQWLLDWTSGYLTPVADWSLHDVADLTRWFVHTRECLEAALPDKSASTLPHRWNALIACETQDPVMRGFADSIVGLVSWVGQSGGFNDLLQFLDAPVGQHGYFTLRTISRRGPIPIAEVAEQLAIHPSQASKRIRQLVDLGLVDRAVDAFDRRSSLVRASSKGTALEQRVGTSQLDHFRRLLGELDPIDQLHWEPLMTRYLSALDDVAVSSGRWAGSAGEGLFSV